MSETENRWTCSMCTYDNYQASTKCSLCLHPRRSEVIQLPPAMHEKALVIKDLQSSSVKTPHSDFIICPPSCSSSVDDSNNPNSSQGANAYSCVTSDEFLLKKYDGHPVQHEHGPEISEKSWSCLTCMFLNVSNNAWCSKCQTSKPAGDTNAVVRPSLSCAEEMNSKNNKWKCPYCTYENWNASKKCVICHNNLKSLHNFENTETCKPSEAFFNSQVEPVSLPSSSNAENYLENLNKETKGSSTQAVSSCKSQADNLASNREETNKSPSRRSSEEDKGMKNLNETLRSSSSSSNSSHSSDDAPDHGSIQPRHSRQRRKSSEKQASSSLSAASSSQRYCGSGGKLSRSNSSNHLYSPSRLEMIDNRSFKKRSRNLNWLFLKACTGVVEGNAEAVDAYLAHGGNIARCLTLDEINSLSRPSAFDIGHTLVHLAIRFQRHNILALLLTPEIAPRGFKRNPAHLSPDVADLIRREITMGIRTRKGDFHCKFLSECSTFQLPIEICDLPSSIQQILFNELLDKDVQKELEEESAINWSQSLLRMGECSNRLYALWNRSAGDCLLDSVLQATWGVFDRDNVLRMAMSESLQDCSTSFYKRWRDWELHQATLTGYSLTERQCLQDWAFIHSLAKQPGAALEHCHIFVLSHILRRPIIIYGIKYLKSFRGDALGFAKFQGVYLPFLWDQSFCYTSPIALGYTRGHFTALVTMENDMKDIHASARHRNPFNTIKHLPLVDSDGKILPIHFTGKGEGDDEEQRKEILQEWLDCHMTDDGLLVARQRSGKRSPSVTRLVDGWLDHYRHMSFRRLGEEGDSDDNDE